MDTINTVFKKKENDILDKISDIGFNKEKYNLIYYSKVNNDIVRRGLHYTTMDLTLEQLVGLIMMSSQLIPYNKDYDQIISIQKDSDNIYINDNTGSIINPHWVGYNISDDEWCINADIYIQLYNCKEIDWATFIKDNQFIREPGNNESKITYDDILFPYSCLLTNGENDAILVQFKTYDFVQGAITACQWFNLDYKSHILLLHKNTDLIQLI